MKYISLLLLSCTILACLPDKTQAHKYHQATFEVVDGKLIEAKYNDVEIKKMVSSIYKGGLAYSFCLAKPSKKDTLFFTNVYFSPLNKYPPPQIGFTPTYVRFNYGKYYNKDLNLDIIIIGDEHASNVKNLPLPSYIDSAERAKNWNVIFPYRIKGKQKCLIVYDLDTFWVKPRVYPPGEEPEEDPIHHPPLDSIYHFP